MLVVNSVKCLILDKLSDDGAVQVDFILDVLIKVIFPDFERNNDEEEIHVSPRDVSFLCLLLGIEVGGNFTLVVLVDGLNKILGLRTGSKCNEVFSVLNFDSSAVLLGS